MRSAYSLARDRLVLLRLLTDADGWVCCTLLGVQLGQGLVPAAAALTMGMLVGRVEAINPSAQSGTATSALWWAFAGFAGTLVLGHLLDAASAPISQLAKSQIDGAHRSRVTRLACADPMIDRLEQPDIQDLIRSASADPLNWTERTPGDGAVAMAGLLARYVGALGSCCIIIEFAWWLVPVVVAPAFAARSLNRRRRLAINRRWSSGAMEGRRADYWRNMVTSAASAKELRLLGFGGWAIEKVSRHSHQMLDPVWDVSRREQIRQVIVFFVLALPLAMAFAVVAISAAHGGVSTAKETTLLSAAWAVMLAVGNTTDAPSTEGAQPPLAAFGELKRALGGDLPQATEHASPPPFADGGSRIELDAVGFGYGKSLRQVLKCVDLCIEAGQTVALVGLNGAGKSTLIKLISGLYAPTSGEIRVDGVALRDVPVETWRRQITVAFQDFVRYPLSLMDNITLGYGWAAPNETALLAACADSGLEPIIARLPQGLDTPVSIERNGGADLSGGQWQHVALARVLYAAHCGARLIVLDEPTAHLDVRSEAELFARLDQRPAGTGVLLITHRLATVRGADLIVVLDRGEITESGTHEELMEDGGLYAQMFRIQAQRFVAGSEQAG
jgi:ABC-type multidrug transport system fused ATPase/permease subunit